MNLSQIATAIIVVTIASLTYAEQQWCEGKINRIYQSADGNLYIHGSWRSDYTIICNSNSTRNGVTSTVCNNWLSILMTAQLSKSDVIVYYGDSTNCNGLPTYGNSPTPGYVMIK